MNRRLYKSFKEGMKSLHGNVNWRVGEWYKVENPDDLIVCNYGFHASRRTVDAMSYVTCSVIAEVEVRGKSDLSESNKECWSEMRIVRAYDWKKKDSVALSIYAAELCLAQFEKSYPQDKRPRQAIEAAKAWLENPTSENESAAESAARSAASARSAAWSAAESAESAAREDTLNKIDNWIKHRIKTLTPVG